MTEFSDKILSIRQSVGRDYTRPPRDKLDAMVATLWGESGAKGLEYLKVERALSEETIKHFQLGYDANLNAIAIPIFKNKELINIKYRLLEPGKRGKYMAETGAEVWIYNEEGIDAARHLKGVLIVEGEFDLMSCWQAGIRNVVSPASGKDSYGVWLEMLDSIPRIYLAYDNDEAGKVAAMKFSERTGVDKTFEVRYPDGIKDANDFFKKQTKDDFKNLIREASPFYSHQYKSVGDIIVSFMNDNGSDHEISLLPKVKIGEDWLVVLSGKSNVGKTATILNMVKELANKETPCLVMPFERGNLAVGKRFLQILFEKTEDALRTTPKTEWQKLIDKVVDLPVYFTVPKKDNIVDTIVKAKRLFDTKFVFIDHLDYVIRNVGGSRETEIANTLQELKRVAEQNKIVIFIVTHIRKTDQPGAAISRKPGIEDLKGSSSLYQDPECVIMLSSEETGTIDIDIVKNKGAMGCNRFAMSNLTGVISDKLDDF